jgi:2,4-dienoyl-CoA reductase-like NADH-dependent reductase (Old Yellow Enzyme family)
MLAMSLLFSPLKIGSLELRNRFVRSATFEGMAKENGEVSDDVLKLYRNLAKGVIGLIITGHFYVNQLGKASFNQVGIHSDEMIPGLKRLVQEVHEHGGKIVFQLSHAGRQTTKKITGQRPIGPSGRGRDPIFLVKPREMTEDDIYETIQSFGRAAERAVEAGADGIQLHGAHGYLINQFLSPFYNTRTDAWGRSEEGRFRFLEQVFTEIKRGIPKETPILIKLNTHDHTPRQGVTPELAAHYAQRLAGIRIDAVEISSGSTFYSFMNVCRGRVPVQELVDTMPFFKKPIARIMMNRLVGKYDLEEGYHLLAAKSIKPVLGHIPLVLVGGMRRVNHMEEILEKGYADFISMSRPFVREPLLVKRIEAGKSDRASCVSCNRCLGAIANRMPLRCYNKPD